MEEQKKSVKKLSLVLILLAVILGIPLILVILLFILALSPFLTIGFVAMKIINYKGDKHEQNLKLEYKLKTDKNLIKLQYLQSKQ